MTAFTNIIHGTADTARNCKCPLCAIKTQEIRVSNGVKHKREEAAAEQAKRERRAELRRGS